MTDLSKLAHKCKAVSGQLTDGDGERVGDVARYISLLPEAANFTPREILASALLYVSRKLYMAEQGQGDSETVEALEGAGL